MTMMRLSRSSVWASLALLTIWSAMSIAHGSEANVIDQQQLTAPSLSEQAQRDLVTVHLYVDNLSSDGSGSSSSSWTSNGIRKCGSPSGSTSDSSSTTTVVQFTYNIETNSSNPSSVEDTINRRLKNMMVNSVADVLCSSRRNLRMLSSERRLGLEQVDGSTADESTGTCQPVVKESESCKSFGSSLTVAFGDEPTTVAKVRMNVLKTVQSDMDNGVYKKKLNQGLQGTGVSVTNIDFTSTIPTPPSSAPHAAPVYISAAPPPAPVPTPASRTPVSPTPVSPTPVSPPVSPTPVQRPVYHATAQSAAPSPKAQVASSQNDRYSTSRDGLSRTGKILVIVAAIILLLLLLACCWARHVVVNRNKRRLGATEESGPKAMAVKTDDGASVAGQISEDGESYVSTSMNDLGRYHSKLDVHKCTSAMCRACNPHLANGKPPTLAQIAEGMTTAPSSPDDDDNSTNEPPPPPPPQRRGRTRTARPRKDHPITFLRVMSPEVKPQAPSDEEASKK